MIRVDDHSSMFLARDGGMHAVLEPHLNVADTDCLLGELFRAATVLTSMSEPEIQARFRGDTSLSAGGGALCLAPWGLLGVRVRDRLWLQCYVNGWPVTPVTPLEAPGVALIQGLSLRSGYFTGLPYSLSDIRQEIHRFVEPFESQIDLRRAKLALDDPTPPAWILDPAASLSEIMKQV